MEKEIEALLFAYGKPVKLSVLAKILEKAEKEIKEILEQMKLLDCLQVLLWNLFLLLLLGQLLFQKE